MNRPEITFRPHHFLCSLGFQGQGYSDEFTANMSRIVVDTLRAPGGDEVMISVTGATDDICAPCPKRRAATCAEQEGMVALDTRHAHALKVFIGSRISWGDAKRRIVKHVPPGGLQTLCAGCQWLELGMCENALAKLHAESDMP